MAHRIYRLRDLWKAEDEDGKILDLCLGGLFFIKKFKTADELFEHINQNVQPGIDDDVIFLIDLILDDLCADGNLWEKWAPRMAQIEARARVRRDFMYYGEGKKTILCSKKDYRAFLSLWKKFADKYGLFEEVEG